MRFGASTLSRQKTMSKNNYSKGFIPNKYKKLDKSTVDTFLNLNAWIPNVGTWSTSGSVLSTSTPASGYPILTNFDIKSQDITATISLDSAGPGVLFWHQDDNNYWAGATFYTSSSESYATGTYDCNCRSRGYCFGRDANGALWGCDVCDTCYNYSTTTRYDFYIKIIKKENAVFSDVINISLRSLCSISSGLSPCTVGSTDNINGIRLTTSGDVITLQARDDLNNFYGTAISYTATNPIKGYNSGVIYTPGSNYLVSSNVSNISIVAN